MTNSKRFLIVDDSPEIRELVIDSPLSQEGIVDSAGNGQEALKLLDQFSYQLILLDWLIPDFSGIQLCHIIKEKFDNKIPILMITAKNGSKDIVSGLDAGADDYIVKPFEMGVLMARVRAILRRFSSPEDAQLKNHLSFGPILLDLSKHEVNCEGQVIDLTLTEFKILRGLLERPEMVFTRQQLIRNVFGEGFKVSERVIDNHLVGLRKKLGKNQHCIETVRGIGYKLKNSPIS